MVRMSTFCFPIDMKHNAVLVESHNHPHIYQNPAPKQTTTMCPILYTALLFAAVTISSAIDYDWAQPRHDFPGWNDVRQWYIHDIEQAKSSGKVWQVTQLLITTSC